MKVSLSPAFLKAGALIWALTGWLWGASAQSLSRQDHLLQRKDTLLQFHPFRQRAQEQMNQQKLDVLLAKAREAEQKSELRNALRYYLQALTHLEKGGAQEPQVEILLELARVYEQWEIPERSLDYLKRALIKINSHQVHLDLKPKALEKVAEAHASLGHWSSAEKNLNEVLGMMTYSDDRSYKLRLLARLSEVYYQQKKIQEVLQTNLKMLELEKSFKNPEREALMLNNIGFTYKTLGQYDKAIENFQLALDLLSSNTKMAHLISIRINLASAYNQQNQYAKALSELFRALKLAEQEKDIHQQAEIRNYLSLIYYNTQDFQNSHFHGKKAVELSTRSGDLGTMIKAFRTYSFVLNKLGEYAEAFSYLDKCYDLRDSLSHIEVQKVRDEMSKRLSVERTEKELRLLLTDAEKSEFEIQRMSLEAERKQKDLELLTKEKELQAASYKTMTLEKERALEVSKLQAQKLKSEKMMQEMALQQFENAISAQQLEKNNRENRILLLEQEKKLLEKSKNLQQAQLSSQASREKFIKALAILLALVFVSISYGFVSIRNKNQRLRKSQQEIEQANASLEELNQEIFSKNKNITDSILYARGIQEAILPEVDRWKAHFPDSFILYKPRDIVSGDFYYLSHIRNKTFVAFADCTGHGVPGALMSLIGHNLLSSSIEINGNDDPDQILKELDEGIRRTLRNQLSHNRDSMELGLCILDHETQQFTFAASMRSLFVIRNGDIEEWRGDRQPLGTDKPITKAFTQYKAPLNTLESIYLSSDGFQDQLGGPENKRFLSNRLRNLIRSLSDKPMPLQKEELEQAFEEWKGNQRQLDDVMLIGIRLS